MNAKPAAIILIEDDPGHAGLIEKNMRRAGVNSMFRLYTDGTSAIAIRQLGLFLSVMQVPETAKAS